VRYLTLELINQAFDYMGASGRILLVNANEAHTFTLENEAIATFNPAGFSMKLLDSGFSISISGGGIDAVDQLEKLAASEDMDVVCVLREYLEGGSAPESIYTGNLGSPKISAKSDLVFTAKFLSPKSIAFPRTLYDKSTHPGL